MKIVISDKNGKSYQVDIPKGRESALIGKKIGETIEGGIVGAPGYTLEITGGSDISGFPMRADVWGPRKIRVLLSGKPGFRKKKKGELARKMVRGNTITDEIFQVNTKVLEAGATPLEQLFPSAAKKEES